MKFFLFLGMLLIQQAVAAELVTLPVPPNVTPEIIAEDFRFNGSPMQIVQFIALDADEVTRFYRRFFSEKARDGKYSEQKLGKTKQIGALMDKTLVNVEFMPEGKKTTRILVSSLDPDKMQAPEKLAKDIPRLPGSTVTQHQESRDGQKKNRMVFITNRHSVEGNAMYLREQYQRLGWSRLGDHTVKTSQQRQLMFGKANKHLLVDVQRMDINTTMVIYSEMEE
ncbi:hypothetical protein AGMMS49545_02890 [Betaproteobacteria bacterium]|nr:hypothetical protein AGMMS49545_02890 [Betaproteobacteria bacterium]GHU47438.1 hypothetical protein AGMMS50289_22630 [Betaproteobacteria bacterium]